MTIYLVTSGAYTDYSFGIYGAFSSRALAEAYIEAAAAAQATEEAQWAQYANIELWELDAGWAGHARRTLEEAAR